jgi:uncharacterized protein (DUF1697 family)
VSGMERYVAFVRAINVGGHASVRMADLKDAFAAAGCKGVRTYILAGDGSADVFRSVRELERIGFYGFPNNFIEKELGVPATSRNWSTLTKIVALIRAGSRPFV